MKTILMGAAAAILTGVLAIPAQADCIYGYGCGGYDRDNFAEFEFDGGVDGIGINEGEAYGDWAEGESVTVKDLELIGRGGADAPGDAWASIRARGHMQTQGFMAATAFGDGYERATTSELGSLRLGGFGSVDADN